MRMPWRTFWMKPKPEDDIYDLFEIELSGDEGIEILETKIKQLIKEGHTNIALEENGITKFHVVRNGKHLKLVQI